jgi:hypothetical protein
LGKAKIHRTSILGGAESASSILACWLFPTSDKTTLAMAMMLPATDGGTNMGTAVYGVMLHNRFGNRNARALRHLPTASSIE